MVTSPAAAVPRPSGLFHVLAPCQRPTSHTREPVCTAGVPGSKFGQAVRTALGSDHWGIRKTGAPTEVVEQLRRSEQTGLPAGKELKCPIDRTFTDDEVDSLPDASRWYRRSGSTRCRVGCRPVDRLGVPGRCRPRAGFTASARPRRLKPMPAADRSSRHSARSPATEAEAYR